MLTWKKACLKTNPTYGGCHGVSKAPILLFLAFFLVACATVQQITPTEVQQKWFPFLDDGKTTKQEVLLRLGKPASTFQNERIFSYRLKEDHRPEDHCEGSSVSCEKQQLIPVAQGPYTMVQSFDETGTWIIRYRPVDAVPYNLVLSFDEKGILQKHNLIKVR